MVRTVRAWRLATRLEGESITSAGCRPGASRRIESRYLHRDGSWRWSEATCINLHEPAFKAIVVNVHDITDRDQAEEAVRTSSCCMSRFAMSDVFIMLGPDSCCIMSRSAYQHRDTARWLEFYRLSLWGLLQHRCKALAVEPRKASASVENVG